MLIQIRGFAPLSRAMEDRHFNIPFCYRPSGTSDLRLFLSSSRVMPVGLSARAPHQ